jgi:hypothetical protein
MSWDTFTTFWTMFWKASPSQWEFDGSFQEAGSLQLASFEQTKGNKITWYTSPMNY